MIVLSAALLGALLGGFTAKKRGGKLADIAQYATVYAIAFAIVGMLATILIHRAAI
ncbi:MAG: apolipoprotein acyltransferase [Pseudodonghicola sp.]